MRGLTGLLAAGFVGLASTAAMAQTNGWYLGGDVGWNDVPRTSLSGSAGVNGGNLTTNNGYGLLGDLGYGFGQFRLEGEAGWRDNNAHTVAGSTGVSTSAGGSYSGLDLMVNGLYDIPTGTAWSPYLGVGLGGVDASLHSLTSAGKPVASGDKWVLGYQGIAGISYAVNDNLALKLDYHYLQTQKAGYGLNAAVGGGTVDAAYHAHTVLVGFTYKFGAPAPAPAPMAAMPAPAPAPAPAPMAAPPPVVAPPPKNYLVFFDFDKSAITADAQKIIETAATNFQGNHGAVIHLTGHTDTVGTEEYNMALSIRRANAVKAALVKLGIPENEITVVGKGKLDPLVPTADGVREPQNRRVEIVLE